MFFGNFLVDKGLISEEQLLDALVYQAEHRPSIIRLLRSKSLISDQDILTIVAKSIEHKKSVNDIIISDGYLEKDDLFNIQKNSQEHSIGIGEALIKLHFLEISDFENALNDYSSTSKPDSSSQNYDNEANADIEISSAALESMKELGLPSEEVEENIEVSNAALESMKELGLSVDELTSADSVNEVAVSDAALESLKELGIDLPGNINTDESLNSDSDPIFSKDKYEKILEVITQLSNGYDLQNIDKIKESFESLYEYSKAHNLNYSTKLLTSYMPILSRLIQGNDLATEVNYLSLSLSLKKTIDLVFAIHSEYNQDENKLLVNTPQKEMFLSSLKEGLEYHKICA